MKLTSTCLHRQLTEMCGFQLIVSTVYADNSVGPETVNIMPLSTLEATKDHAEVCPTLGEGVGEAREPFEELREAGVDYYDVTRVLEREAVEKFADSYGELVR